MICDACGKAQGGMIGMGGATICRQCDPDVRAEMERLRAEGKSVNVSTIAKKIFREAHSAGGYLLRDIPEDLWNRAKHRAVDDGDSLRDLLLKALRAYLG
jgi:hypothetical protein